MSLNEINKIEEKVEDEFINQRINSFVGIKPPVQSKFPLPQSVRNVETTSEQKPPVQSKLPLPQSVRNVETTSETKGKSGSLTSRNVDVKSKTTDSSSENIPTKKETVLVNEDWNKNKDTDSETSSLHETLTINESLTEAINCVEYKPETVEMNDPVESLGYQEIYAADAKITKEENQKITLEPTVSEHPSLIGQPKSSLKKKTSMSDFLSRYSNINSLSEKSAFNIPKRKQQETVDKNKTVITISDSTQLERYPKRVMLQPRASLKETKIESKSPKGLTHPREDKNDVVINLKAKNVTDFLNLNKGTDHQTIITLSGDSSVENKAEGDSVFHASIVYVGDESEPRGVKDDLLNGENHNALRTSNDGYVHSDPKSSIPIMSPAKGKHLHDSTFNNDKGDHVTVIAVEEPGLISPVYQGSGSSFEKVAENSDEEDDPFALTRRIVASSRRGSSNRPIKTKKVNIANASVPINSPFSPVSKSKPENLAKKFSLVNNSSISLTENVHSPKELGSQEFNDEGVYFTLSDGDLHPSAPESNSTSSLDINKEGNESMVLCH